MDKIKRDTNANLMCKVLELTRKNGHYKKAEVIMDYFLEESRDIRELTDYQFDFLTKLNFGGSEGIYLDCYIEGVFSEDGNEKCERLRCGTFKTLLESLEAMQIMGELTGSLTYYASKYVNTNIRRYYPLKELE